MEFIAEVIGAFIAEFLLFYPGAAIRWVFLRKKKSFDELLDDDFSTVNSIVAGFFIAGVIAAAAVLKHYIK